MNAQLAIQRVVLAMEAFPQTACHAHCHCFSSLLLELVKHPATQISTSFILQLNVLTAMDRVRRAMVP